jgi:mannan endo-1,4-beta-mannosidase
MSFVKVTGTAFTVDGKPFFVTGVNNHYLTFGSRDEVTGVLDDAVAMGANVVRTFLQPTIGSLDGSVATIWSWRNKADASDLGVGGAYLLYWDPRASAMAINDGPNGMEKVDFLIAEAGKRHLRLIIAFQDFWAYGGGAQQMRACTGAWTSPDFSLATHARSGTTGPWSATSHSVSTRSPGLLTGTTQRSWPGS